MCEKKVVKMGTMSVAGTQYRMSVPDLNDLLVGEDVDFELEPTNEYDTNAIKVNAFFVEEQVPRHIGYVPAMVACHFTPLLLSGVFKVTGTVVSRSVTKTKAGKNLPVVGVQLFAEIGSSDE